MSGDTPCLTLATVGDTYVNWNFDNLPQFTAPTPIYTSTNTITAVDSASASWTRSRSIGSSAVHWSDTIFANNPRTGFVHRPATTVTASDGSTVTNNEFTA